MKKIISILMILSLVSLIGVISVFADTSVEDVSTSEMPQTAQGQFCDAKTPCPSGFTCWKVPHAEKPYCISDKSDVCLTYCGSKNNCIAAMSYPAQLNCVKDPQDAQNEACIKKCGNLNNCIWNMMACEGPNCPADFGLSCRSDSIQCTGEKCTRTSDDDTDTTQPEIPQGQYCDAVNPCRQGYMCWKVPNGLFPYCIVNTIDPCVVYCGSKDNCLLSGSYPTEIKCALKSGQQPITQKIQDQLCIKKCGSLDNCVYNAMACEGSNCPADFGLSCASDSKPCVGNDCNNAVSHEVSAPGSDSIGHQVSPPENLREETALAPRQVQGFSNTINSFFKRIFSFFGF